MIQDGLVHDGPVESSPQTFFRQIHTQRRMPGDAGPGRSHSPFGLELVRRGDTDAKGGELIIEKIVDMIVPDPE